MGLLSCPHKSNCSCYLSSLGTHLIPVGQQWGYQVVTSSPKWGTPTFPSSLPTNQTPRLITYHPASSHLPQGPRKGWGREAASPKLKDTSSVPASVRYRLRMKNGGHPPQTRSRELASPSSLARSLALGCQTEEGGNKRSNASRGRG